ncbi:MAG: heme ABC exporter ATP-binding protein CcmA [Dongiaceae bacterium]
MPMLAGRGLACIRGDRLIFRALDLAVAAGGALLLRGPNGSGKSSLLRCLASLLPLSEGVVTWDGRPVAEDREGHRGRLRYIGHQDAVKPALSVAQNLRGWARLWDLDERTRVEPALDRLGLAALAGLPAQLLSAGQRRRLALARLALAPASLWLLDEPTTSLDDEGTKRFAGLADEHRGRGGAIVLSSHGGPDFAVSELFLPDFRPASDEPAA